MLNVYIKNVDRNKVIYLNDAWFDYNLESIKIDDNIKRFMKIIDDSIYIKDDKMYSKFDKELCINMKNLSTGCKTLINVYYFKNKVFEICECGKNVISEIFKLDKGNVFIPCYIFIPNFNGKVNVFTDNGNILMTRKELLSYLEGVFPNGY